MSRPVFISPLQASDFHAIRDLATLIWKEDYSEFLSVPQIEFMLQDRYKPTDLLSYIDRSDRWFDVLRVETDIAGFLRTLRMGPALKLQELYVAKKYRGKGYGTYLLMHAESIADQQHCGSIFLYVNRSNARAIRLYQNHGYQITDQQVVDIGQGYVMDDYRMAKMINRK